VRRWWAAGLAVLLTACAGGDPAAPAPAAAAAPWPAGGFDYQLGGAYPPPPGVTVVTRDRAEPPAPGVWSVCYVNAYQTQPAETAWWRVRHPALLLPVEDPDWPGEVLLDTRRPAELAAVVGLWLDGCAAAGYRAVELDNLDSWTRSGGRLTAADALAYARLLIGRAHGRGLLAGQKNAAELGGAGRAAGFDFAVTEECGEFAECGDYTAVYGRAVLEVEYTRAGLAAACPADHPVVLRDRDVQPAGEPGHVRATC
jgi:hypothetical protein